MDLGCAVRRSCALIGPRVGLDTIETPFPKVHSSLSYLTGFYRKEVESFCQRYLQAKYGTGPDDID